MPLRGLMVVVLLLGQLGVELLVVGAVDNKRLEELAVKAYLEEEHLEAVLDDPPDDAVDPHPQRPEGVVAQRQAHDGQAVEDALGPEAGEEGGDDEGDEGGGEEDGARGDHEEELVLGARREERQEGRQRHLPSRRSRVVSGSLTIGM